MSRIFWRQLIFSLLPRVSLIGAKTWWSCKVVSFNPSQIGHLTLAHGSIFLLRDIYFEAIVEGKRWHPKLVVIIVNFWYKLLWNGMTKIPYLAHLYAALWHTDTLSVANSKIVHPCTRHFPRWWTEAVRTVGAEDSTSSRHKWHPTLSNLPRLSSNTSTSPARARKSSQEENLCQERLVVKFSHFVKI